MISEGSKQVSVMLPRSLVARLDEAADARMVGRRWLIERLLADGLDRLIPADELRITQDRRAVPVEPGERPSTAVPPPIPVFAPDGPDAAP